MIKKISYPELFDPFKDLFYSPNNSYLNIVINIIGKPNIEICSCIDLFNKHVDIMIEFASKISNHAFQFFDQNPQNKIDLILYDLNRICNAQKFSREAFNNFSTEEDSIRLIKRLLDTFYVNHKDVITNQCNSIFKDYYLEFSTFDDFTKNDGSLFLPLLQRLKLKVFQELDGQIYPPLKKNSIEDLHKIFNKAGVPFILDDKSLEQYDETVIAVQIQNILKKFNPQYLDKIVQKKLSTSENKDEPLLLRMMNAIGSRNGLHYESIESILKVKKLQHFIECIQCKPIPKNDIKITSNNLSEIELESKFNAIIQYLRKEREIFKVLLFDFRDEEKKKHSAVLLAQNIIDLFYIKESKCDVIKRCDDLIGSKVPIKSIESFKDKKAFFILSHFYRYGNINIEGKIGTFFTFESLKEKFKEYRIPLVVTEDCFTDLKFNKRFIFYQLYLIFDISRFKFFLSICEKMIKSVNALQKMSHIRISEIMLNITPKLNCLKKKLNRKEESDEMIHSYFSSRVKHKHNLINEAIQKLNDLKAGAISKLNNFESIKDKALDFWSLSTQSVKLEKKFKFDLGLKLVIPDKLSEQDDVITLMNEDIKRIEPFFKSQDVVNLDISKLPNENINSCPSFNLNYPQVDKFAYPTLDAVQYPQIDNPLFDNASCPLFKNIQNYQVKYEKLYKFFIYNAENKRWEFNVDDFNSFAVDYDLFKSRVYLVLFLNSMQNDLIELNSNFIKDKYPNLTENEIFVYALFHEGYRNSNNAKPIFLLLHVPQILPNIDLIIMQIYIYLFSISAIQIVIPSNGRAFYCQFEFTQFIFNVAKCLNLRLNFESKLLFLKDEPGYTKDDMITINGNFISKIIEKLPTSNLCPTDFKCKNERFHNCLNKLTANFKFKSFFDLKYQFDHYRHYELSNLYILLKMQPQTEMNRILNDIINNRAIHLNTERTNLILFDEFACFTPGDDFIFTQKYRNILCERIKKDSFVPDKLLSELKKVSEDLVNKLEKIIKSQNYWSQNDIAIIKDSYSSLIDEVFNDIIFICGFGRLGDFVYKNYLDILSRQKEDDLKSINKIFDDYYKKIGENVERNRDFRSYFNKSPRYIINEVENMKSIEVIVKEGGIDTEIEQDF